VTEISERAKGLCGLTHDMGPRMHPEQCAYCPEIQRALDAERQEARAKALAEMAAVIEAMRWKGSE